MFVWLVRIAKLRVTRAQLGGMIDELREVVGRKNASNVFYLRWGLTVLPRLG